MTKVRIKDIVPSAPYQDVVALCRGMGLWQEVGVLVQLAPMRRPTYLKKILLRTAQSPKGQHELLGSDWERLDAQLECLAKLLMAAVVDIHLLPLLENRVGGRLQTKTTGEILKDRARISMECQDALPAHTQILFPHLDQTAEIYQKTRRVFFEALVEAAQYHGLYLEAPQYLTYLLDQMEGRYKALAVQVLCDMEPFHPYVRAFLLGQLVARRSRIGQEHRRVFDAQIKYGVNATPAEQIVAFGEIQAIIGISASKLVLDELCKCAARIQRIQGAARSFTAMSGTGLKLVGLTPESLRGTLCCKFNGRVEESVVDRIRHHIDTWVYDDLDVELVLEMCESFETRPVFYAWLIKPKPV